MFDNPDHISVSVLRISRECEYAVLNMSLCPCLPPLLERRTVRVLKTPRSFEIDHEVRLPNKSYPSDHFMICADLQFKDVVRPLCMELHTRTYCETRVFCHRLREAYLFLVPVSPPVHF